jgi:multidrug efflux pump subunit AcrA (membrane-fusion protein)
MNTSRFRLRSWLLAAGVLLVGLTGLGIYFYQFPPEGSSREEPPKPPPPLQGVECLGRVDVEGGLLDLGCVRIGRVVEVPVRPETDVSAGTVLLRLDDQAARLQLKQSQAALQAAQAQLKQAEETARLQPDRVAVQEALYSAAQKRMATAREEVRRMQQLADQALISKEEVTGARDLLEELQSVAQAGEKMLSASRQQNSALPVELARADVARAQAVVDQAQDALEQCSLRAPEAGRVLKVRTGPGEVVGPQKPAILFAPARPRIVRAEVEQEFIGQVEVGQPAQVRDELNPGESWPGHVTRIADWYSPSSIPQAMQRFSDVSTAECLITLDPGHPPLRIGRRMTVLIGKTKDSQ